VSFYGAVSTVEGSAAQQGALDTLLVPASGATPLPARL
jgi:hypothetical protein